MSSSPPSSQESPPLLCDGIVSTRRGLLALIWLLVMVFTAIAFLTALFFTISAPFNANNDDDNNNRNQNSGDPALALTSRAMAFAALWTAVLAALLFVFGTVILGWQSPTGQYYTCCSSSVFRTTPLGIGSFIGLLIMFANLTLVCAVLFGEFQVKDFQRDDQNGGKQANGMRANAVEQSSGAFSIMCMFLTVVYASFAALTFTYSKSIIEEHEADARQQSSISSRKVLHYNGYDGYIGERFDVLGVRRMPDIGERLDVRRIPGNTFVTNASDGIV